MSEPASTTPLSRRLPGSTVAAGCAASAALFLLLLLGWAALTEVEVVTTAPAVARALEGTATVRSPATRLVQQMLVREGTSVARGDPIVELESAYVNAQWRSARAALGATRQVLAEQRAVLMLLDGHGSVATAPAPVRLRVEAQHNRLAQLDGEIDILETEIRLADQRARAAAHLLGIAEDRDRSVRRAAQLGAMSPFDVHGVAQQFWSRQADVEAARGRVTALQQQLEVQHRVRTAARLEFREGLLERVAALEVEVAERQMRVADVAEQRRHSVIRAATGGLVDRLLIAAGDFIERGEPVAVIVPAAAEVYFEVRLAPAQMGFLRTGLPCRIKLDALPFPRYGALPCTLTRLGNDVVSADRRGDHYLARARPAAQQLWADGTPVGLRPGASGWVDIVAGRRSVLGYVTEPLQRFARESLRER